MKILMLLENEYPPDNRVEKEAAVLIASGHEVHLLCNTRKGNPLKENVLGVQVFRMPLSKFMYKMSALVLLFPFYLSRWRRKVVALHREYKYDVIHVHDLPLSEVGLHMKRRYGLKLICDQHEYYSDWIVETAHYNTAIGKIVKSLSNWKRYERKALENADRVITVEEPLREQYLKEYDIEPAHLFTLPNTPSAGIFHPENVDPDKFAQYKEPFTLLYFGGLDILRGIDQVIHSIPHIVKEIPSFKLVLAGVVYKGYDPLESARCNGVEDRVDFIGWVDLDDLPSLISVSDLGIFIPPSHRVEINKTIATKIYQFLAMHTPVIVGRAELMKQFVEENGIGLSVDESDPDEIGRAVLRYSREMDIRKEMIENCRKICDQYTWESTSGKLIRHYSELIQG